MQSLQDMSEPLNIFMVLLSMQHLTRSNILVTLLNKMGHGYSSAKIEEKETALAVRATSEVEKDGVFIPSSIDRKAPVVFCWDNNDLTEETSGASTTHCRNRILIQ